MNDLSFLIHNLITDPIRSFNKRRKCMHGVPGLYSYIGPGRLIEYGARKEFICSKWIQDEPGSSKGKNVGCMKTWIV